MPAVITGDIINSRKRKTTEWQPLLRQLLERYGSSPEDWEIYRGDSFQLVMAPREALSACIYIKAGMKQIKSLDVRLAIGIGEEEFKAGKVTESNGPAYFRSGECFESLKKQSLGIKTSDPELDELLNLLFSLSLLSMDNWSPTVAEAVKTTLENPDKSQKEIAEVLGKSQSSLSEALSRGGFEEVMQMEQYYQKRLDRL